MSTQTLAIANMKKLRSSLKPSLKLPHRNRTTSSFVREVDPPIADNATDSIFLLLPTEMRLAVYDHIGIVDVLMLRWTCQQLRDEIAPPVQLQMNEFQDDQITGLSFDNREALRYRVRLDRFVKLCDQGKDQTPDASRALCFACLDYHKPNCFFPVTLQKDPRWRVCKKDALLRLCPCLCIDRYALANLKNARIWAHDGMPIDVQHVCGLIKGTGGHSGIDLTCASGWWDWIAYLSISYVCATTDAIDSDSAVDSFLAVAVNAKLSLCPHMTCHDKEVLRLLKQMYLKSRSRSHIAGAVLSCPFKHCETSATWKVRGTSASLKVKRQLGDIWKQGSLDNDKWLAQVSSDVSAYFTRNQKLWS